MLQVYKKKNIYLIYLKFSISYFIRFCGRLRACPSGSIFILIVRLLDPDKMEGGICRVIGEEFHMKRLFGQGYF